jgi:light-harvesting complex II chlorophyll a/b binding protein 5
MVAAMLTKQFMGQSLKGAVAPLQPTQAPRAAPVQAFFKKAEKNVKRAAAPAKGNATQALKKGQSLVNKAGKEAKKAESKGGGLFSKFGKQASKAEPKAAKQVKRAAPTKPLQAAKKAATQVKKAAPQPVKKAAAKAPSPKKSATKRVATTPRPIRQAARAISPGKGLDQWYGPSRALYLPRGLLDPQDIPSYLNGSLAGDYGYDPLGLGSDPATVEKYRAYELIHARWAMLAAAGIVIPEGLQANGASIKGGTWFETGAEMLNGGTLNYFAVPFGIVNNPLPLALVTIIEVALIGAVENYRRTQSGPPGYSPGKGGGKFDSDVFDGLDTLYPGGPFDPLALADDPETLQELKVKEIKNGRLAMISVLGFAFQGYVTGEGPYANWSKHVSDPFGYNLLTILGAEDRLPTL